MTTTPGAKMTAHCDPCACETPQVILTWSVPAADFTARCIDCGAVNEL